MRVSSNMEPTILAGIANSESALQAALQQVSTGQRVTVPGDDPSASALMVQNLTTTNNLDQYTKNANSALGATQVADSVLTQVVAQLTQAVSLGVQGATGTNSPTNRSAAAVQVQGILTSVVSEANTNYQGVAVFAGTKATTTAFVADAASPTGYAYQGNEGINSVQVGDAMQVQVNLPGSDVFDNPSASVLSALSSLATALQSGSVANINTATNAVTASLNYVSAQHGVYGNSVNQLNAQETFLSQEKVTLSTQANNLIGIDQATADENLVHAETNNSAMLAAAAKVLPNSLLDYLK